MKHYRELWSILALTFCLFFVLSFSDGIALSDDFELRTAGFAKVVFPDKAAGAAATASPADTTAHIEDKEIQESPDTATQTILFIGDSMLDGLSPRMSDYCLQNGHKLVSVRWYSSSTRKWGGSDRLHDLIAEYHPTYVFVCLGSNELFINKVDEKCGPSVDNMLQEIGKIPYVWIGPPNWKTDTGINALLQRKTHAGCFFTSNGMNFERRKDGAHPTAASAAQWLDSVMRWMPEHSAHPIRMSRPEKPLPAKAPGQITVKVIAPDE